MTKARKPPKITHPCPCKCGRELADAQVICQKGKARLPVHLRAALRDYPDDIEVLTLVLGWFEGLVVGGLW